MTRLTNFLPMMEHTQWNGYQKSSHPSWKLSCQHYLMKNTRSSITLKWVANRHCLKHTRLQLFYDPYFPVYRQNRRFCPLYGKVRVRENPYSGIFLHSEAYWVEISSNSIIKKLILNQFKKALEKFSFLEPIWICSFTLIFHWCYGVFIDKFKELELTL